MNTSELTPLLFGVSGHIDLFEEHKQLLRATIREQLRQYLEKYPHTPIIMLSPLAAGADQIAAEAAIELRDSGQPVKLYVPLPMAEASYLELFQEEQSRASYYSLRDKADYVYVLDEPAISAGMTLQPEDYYGQVSDHITKYCHVLLALWDGVERDDLKAGTSYSVRNMRYGIESEIAGANKLLDPVTSGIVIHIRTPRKSNGSVNDKIAEPVPIYPANFQDAQMTFDRILTNIETFNEDIHLKVAPDSDVREAIDNLCPAGRVLPPILESLALKYAASDKMAVRLKNMRKKVFKMLLITGVLLVASYELMSQLPIIVIAYIILLAWAGYKYKVGRKREYHRKYLDYRALSEGLRVQLFWYLVGVDQDVSDVYLTQQRSEIEWICSVIRTQNYLIKVQKASNRIKEFEWVKVKWIEDQISYFNGSKETKKREGKRAALQSDWLFLSGVVLIALVYIWNVFESPLAMETWASWLMVPAAVLVAAGIVRTDFDSQMSDNSLSGEHARMHVLFTYGLNKTEQYLNPKDGSSANEASAREVIYKLGQELLDENGSWIYVNRERDVRLPIGLK